MSLASNVEEFNRDVQRYADQQVAEDLSIFTRRIALEVLISVVQNTPVDTGRAKGAWIVSLESPSDALSGIVGEKAEGKKKLSRSQVASIERQARNAGLDAIANAQAFGVIYINNNVDYILYLEEGTARFAPFAMAAQALNEIRAKFA